MPQNNDTSSGFVLAALAVLTLPLAAFVGCIVLLITVIAPPSNASCSPGGNGGGVAVSPVSVPAGLSRLASELWDKPLNMQLGRWYPVGATEYYQGDDTGSTNLGSIPDPNQANLDNHPDTFAELSLLPSNPANGGTFTFQNANALGNLPYMTGLRVAKDGKSIIVYKRDIGYGQGPSEHTAEGFEYRIDLWGPAAKALGVSKDQVDIELAPKTGAGAILEATPGATTEGTGGTPAGESSSGCEVGAGAAEGPLPLTPGQSAKVLPNGLAAAPSEATERVKAMIAAGNRLDHATYLYGGAHGPSLDTLQPAYDCSSAVSYVLHGGGVFGASAEDATELESYGDAGPGQWVSVYANSEHAFMYVAGIRFDTSFNGTDTGPNENHGGPRWRVFSEVPKWAQWVVRHPPGL
jgi:hypothetical protein